MALAETSSFSQPYVYFTLADPAMPFSPTYVASGYPLCCGPQRETLGILDTLL